MKNSISNKIVALLMPTFFIVFGIWMTIESSQMKTMLGTFPSIVGVLTIILGIVQFIQDFRSQDGKNVFANSNPLQVLIALCGLSVYVFLFKRIGYIISTTLLSFFVITQLGYKKWKTAAIVALVFTVIAFFVFKVLLRVKLPSIFIGKLL